MSAFRAGAAIHGRVCGCCSWCEHARSCVHACGNARRGASLACVVLRVCVRQCAAAGHRWHARRCCRVVRVRERALAAAAACLQVRFQACGCGVLVAQQRAQRATEAQHAHACSMRRLCFRDETRKSQTLFVRETCANTRRRRTRPVLLPTLENTKQCAGRPLRALCAKYRSKESQKKSTAVTHPRRDHAC